MNQEDKRHHERVKLPFVIKYQRSQAGPAERWNLVNPINMSESGICFLTMEEYGEGAGMKILLTDPVKKTEYMFGCSVLRCVQAKGRPMFYETVVIIESISDQAKSMYSNLLKEFGRGRRAEG